MSMTLKACPFCGSKDVGFEDVGNPGEFHDYAVTCEECGAFFTRSSDGEVRTKKEVATAWNKRNVTKSGKTAILPIPCTNVEGETIKDWFQKINEELDEFKDAVLKHLTLLEPAERATSVHLRKRQVAEEAADTITVITSMLEKMGIDEDTRQKAQKQVNEKNRKRGRF